MNVDGFKSPKKRGFLYDYGLFGWNYMHLITHPWIVFEQSYYEVKWFLQRGYRGYSDRDVWSIDCYLTSWMPEALKRLKKTTHGYPVDLTSKRWDKKLDGMIAGFKAAKRLQELDFDTKDRKAPKVLHKQVNKGLTLFRDHFFSLWD